MTQLNDDKNKKKKPGFVAFLAAIFSVGAGAQEAPDAGVIEIEEIIVTAGKREQSIQNTAMAISVLSGDMIDKRNLVGMDDYLRTLPGVSMQDRGAGQNSIVIRGITATPQDDIDSTVGVYFGETSVTNLGTGGALGSAGNADIKLVDIERIEVLRGPQGTLYGKGSIGGTARVIPASPNLEQIEGKLAARYSNTGEQGGDNTMIQGVINFPIIEDKLAIRAVAYRFDNSGFIDNVAATQAANQLLSPNLTNAVMQGGVARDRDDVGNDEYTGFRVAALWQPTEELGITLSYFQQEIEQDGMPEVSLDLAGDFQQQRLRTGGAGGPRYEFLANDIDITNLEINYDFGLGTLTSSSSWTNYESSLEQDWSQRGFPGGPYFQEAGRDITVFAEELRFASQFDGSLQFITGLYYEDWEEKILGPLLWSGSAALDPGVAALVAPTDVHIEQLAFFGELSYDITEQISATFGVRYFDYERLRRQDAFFRGITLFLDRRLETAETGQTYKVNLSWAPSDNILFYGQWAEGFRLGRGLSVSARCDADGDGLVDGLGIPVPTSVDSDTSENFELGLKTALFDNRITFNAALYRINWEGIPASVVVISGCALTLNAGKAKSEGVELEVQARLTENLRLEVGTSYSEATLAEDAGLLGTKGQNLPGSADFNFSAGLEYGFSLAGYNAFARVDYAYLSEYFNNFAEIGEAAGDFGQVHLKVGITLDAVDIDVFVNNLTNADDFTWIELNNASGGGGNRAYRIRPRTIGVNIGYRF